MSKVSAQIKSADLLINKAFNSIKNMDEQAYINLFPTFPQLKEFLAEFKNSIKDSSDQAAFADKMNHLSEEVYNKQIKNTYIEKFNELISSGRKMGIDWKQAKLDSFQSSEVMTEGFNIKSLSGNIFFTGAGKQYIIPFSDAIWSESKGGWFGIEMQSVHKKGEYPFNDNIVVREIPIDSLSADTTIMIMDSDLIDTSPRSESKKQENKKPATKKPATKQPAKKPSSSTKPKTKS